MGTLFRLTGNTIQPQAGTRLLKAGDFTLLLEANSLLEAARVRADQVLKEAERAYEERLQEGYADGKEEGKLEHAEKVMATILSSVEFIENMEHSIVDVVTQVVRRILGEISDGERIVALVRQALLTVRSQQRVVIRLAPADEPPVREAMTALLQHAPGSGSFLDIVTDARLERGSCLLESELGVIDASLETQLTALEKALRQKIKG